GHERRIDESFAGEQTGFALVIIVADEAKTIHACTGTNKAVKPIVGNLLARVNPAWIDRFLGQVAIRSDQTSRHDSKRDRPGSVAVTELKRARPDVHLIEREILQKIGFGGWGASRLVHTNGGLQISSICHPVKLLAIGISAG